MDNYADDEVVGLLQRMRPFICFAFFIGKFVNAAISINQSACYGHFLILRILRTVPKGRSRKYRCLLMWIKITLGKLPVDKPLHKLDLSSVSVKQLSWN